MNVEDVESSTTETDTDAEDSGFPKDLRLTVSEKVYATFEQYIGIGAHISRWVSFSCSILTSS